ncbi:hypothetical protein SAMD00019534_003310 [Acytostelium subglobosum LB1]|uniref:hypothetical protein n=1 Tax=Acytostelium subglobosum LB1 TaxID=1410327 RepID=UPI000644D848|nr:hypothetical protein SAMD00019534_003310 [Acytostelium subglobosum LB1]GAM17156.1 hypothetical protein SAMD00019534_003310 [Acytostelium subglobosum LB1]|eukprot:XP_012759218.1 hypothetical protein SAMD00019534_003310 [Acytostelium subglobosum LB1]
MMYKTTLLAILLCIIAATDAQNNNEYFYSQWYNSSSCSPSELGEIDIVMTDYCLMDYDYHSSQVSCQSDQQAVRVDFGDSECKNSKDKETITLNQCDEMGGNSMQASCANSTQVEQMIKGMTVISFYSQGYCSGTLFKMIASPDTVCFDYMKTNMKCVNGLLYQSSCKDKLCDDCGEFQQVEPFCLRPDGIYFGCP